MGINVSNLLCYKLFRMVKLNEQLIDKEMKSFHLCRTQWKVLARFNFLPIPCKQQQLLASIDIDCAHLTRTLEQLEQRGLVRKERLANDKRAYNVFPTKSGIDLVKKIEKVLKYESEILTKGLSKDDKSILKKLLNEMESNVFDELQK